MSKSNFKQELENGKEWVEETVRRVAESLSLGVERVEWSNGRDEFDDGDRWLTFYIDGKPHKGLLFTAQDLTDVPNTPSVRSTLRERIEKFIKSLLPQPKRIGF